MTQKKLLQAALAAALVMAHGWLSGLSAGSPVYAEEQAPNAAPELSITKTGTQLNGGGKPGPTVFTLSFRNLGNADASGIMITETVGAGMQFEVGKSSPGWNCNLEGGVDVCRWERLEPLPADPTGAQPVQTLTFAITPTADLPPQMDTVTNVAVIGDDSKHGPDSNPANNTGTATAMIGVQTTLSGTQRATLVTDANSNGKYEAGDVIEYTFAITNTGTRYANALRLVSDFSTDWNVQIVGGSVNASQGSVSNTATSAYALFGNIAPGGSVAASFRLSSSSEPPLTLPSILHVGTLEDSYGFNTNTNLTAVPIQHTLIAVAATKAGSAAPGAIVKRGEKLSYTLVITNTGPESIANMRIVDEVNDQGGKAQCFSVVAGTVTTSRGTANVTQSGNTERIEITVGALTNGESVSVGFDALVRSTFACTQVFNQAIVYDGQLELGLTNLVVNPIDPLKRVLLPLIRRN